MQAFLKKHEPTTAEHSVKVTWSCALDVVSINFFVTKRTSSPWHKDAVFTEDWAKNWGLWNKDVVEAFLQLRSHEQDLKAPYLEIQVSPLNQPFALIITEPRKDFFAPKTLDFTHSVNLTEKLWEATLKVKLPSELRGTLLYGGFFACLNHEPREFYALDPNPEAAPDFHRPELFLPLSHE